jgi:hypothetical protein
MIKVGPIMLVSSLKEGENKQEKIPKKRHKTSN